jgi:autotransporter-associated beta strand protein
MFKVLVSRLCLPSEPSYTAPHLLSMKINILSSFWSGDSKGKRMTQRIPTKLVRQVARVALSVAALSMASAAYCQESTWVGAGSGNWEDVANWIGQPPNSPQHDASFIRILPRDAATIRLNEPATIGNLTIGTAAPLSFRGETLRFGDESTTGSIVIGSEAGRVLLANPFEIPNELTIQVQPGSGGLDLRSPLQGSGVLNLIGDSNIVANMNSAAWQGVTNLVSGQVRVVAGASFGSLPEASMIVSGGELELNSALLVPVEVREAGRMVANFYPTEVTLHGGTIILSAPPPRNLLSDNSTGGTLLLNIDYAQDISLPASELGETRLIAVDLNSSIPARTRRVITGRLAMDAPSAGTRNRLQLGSQLASLQISTPLLPSRNIDIVEIVEGTVYMSAATDYPGQTIVHRGAHLHVEHPFGLGTNQGTEADATIVRAGGSIFVGQNMSSSEMIILEGGRYSGRGNRDITIRGGGIIESNLENSGRITGEGELAFVSSVLTGNIDFRGQILIAADPNRPSVVEVTNLHAFGSGGQPVAVLGGELNVRVQPANPLRLENGVLRMSLSGYDGDVELRQGILTSGTSPGGPVQMNSPIRYQGDAVQLRGESPSTPLVINEGVIGAGSLTLARNVNVQSVLDIEGDLLVAGTAVNFYQTPVITGQLRLEGQGGAIAQARIHRDMPLPIVLRGGSLETVGQATIFATSPTMQVHAGFLNATLTDLEVIEKSRPGQLTIASIGSSTAEVVVHEGTVRFERGSAMGSDPRGVRIASHSNAAVELIASSQTDRDFRDPVFLQNATGYRHAGSLLLGGHQGGVLHGAIDLGEIGAVVRIDAPLQPFTMQAPIRGGRFSLIGEGSLQLGVPAEHTGPTLVGEFAWGNPQLLLTGDASLAKTSSIELHARGSLVLDKTQSTATIDMIPEPTPVLLRGGSLTLIGGDSVVDVGETLGTVILERGASKIALQRPAGRLMSGKLDIQTLDRKPGSVVVFHHHADTGSLGGSEFGDGQILIGNVAPAGNEILGAWALVEHRGEIDFASYGARGITRSVIATRPNELNGATEDAQVRLVQTPATLAGPATIATLSIDEPNRHGVLVDLGGHPLTIADGGLLLSRGLFRMTNGHVTTSSQSGEMIVHVQHGAAELDVALVDTEASPMHLVKSGPEFLTLSQPNTYRGGTTILDGWLVATHPQAVPVDSEVTVDGGTLMNQSDTPLKLNRLTIHRGLVSGVDSTYSTLGNGAAFASPQGNGVIEKMESGTASLDNAENFRGSVDVRAGTLRVSSRDGTGPTVVHAPGVYQLAFDSRGSSRQITLHGGALHSEGGTQLRPMPVSEPVDVTASSQIHVASGALELAGLQLDRDVTLTKLGAGDLMISGSTRVAPGSVLDIHYGRLQLDGPLVTSDENTQLTIQSTGRDDLYRDEMSVALHGDNRNYVGALHIDQVSVEIGHPFALGAGVTTVTGGGELVLQVEEVHGNLNLVDGRLVTTASHRFVGNLVNGSQIEPGSSPGTLEVSGDFRQDAEGILTMEIASLLATELYYGQQNDLLSVGGLAELNGTLNVELLHGFMPLPDDEFQLFQFQSSTGQFAAIHVPTLPDDRAWNLNDLYRSGKISVVRSILGDSNRDGTFNSSDLVVVFQAGLYETGSDADWSTGDWNGDRVFSSSDLVTAFQAGTYIANAVAVPEPQTFAWIVTFAIGGLGWQYRVTRLVDSGRHGRRKSMNATT